MKTHSILCSNQTWSLSILTLIDPLMSISNIFSLCTFPLNVTDNRGSMLSYHYHFGFYEIAFRLFPISSQVFSFYFLVMRFCIVYLLYLFRLKCNFMCSWPYVFNWVMIIFLIVFFLFSSSLLWNNLHCWVPFWLLLAIVCVVSP